MYEAEIVAIGSEMLTPDKTDTNSLWLTDLLNSCGVLVKQKSVVGDDAARLVETLQDAFSRSDIVVTTGGLGPTEDDITRHCVAKALGRELEFKQRILDSLLKKFKSFGYEMPERNRRQAYLVGGSEAIPNPRGSAVGMFVKENGRLFVILPGPPRESKPMFEQHILPIVKSEFSGIVVCHKSIMVTGMGESAVDEIIAPVYTAYSNPRTSILFSKSEIEIRLSAEGSTTEEADGLLGELGGRITDLLGVSVFSDRGEQMEKVVGRMLAENEQTVSVAESCTGGLVCKRLTNVAGSSGYFVEGVVTYSNDSKISRLSVPEDLLRTRGAVSAEVAAAMASGVRERLSATWGISTTGIAGPGGGTKEKPVGTVYIAIADKHGSTARELQLPGDRELVRWRTSQAVMDLLRRRILKGPEIA